MSDLDRVIDNELDAWRPTTVPPFAVVRTRWLRRRRRKVVGTAVGSLAVFIGAVITASVITSRGGTESASLGGPADAGPMGTGAPRIHASRACTPSDLYFSLTWVAEGDALRGTLTALNHTQHECGLLIKPVVEPLKADQTPVGTTSVMSTELLTGPDALLPGAAAHAAVSWGGGCGTKAGGRVSVELRSGDPVTVEYTGPDEAPCPTDATRSRGHVSTSWFTGLTNPRE